MDKKYIEKIHACIEKILAYTSGKASMVSETESFTTMRA